MDLIELCRQFPLKHIVGVYFNFIFDRYKPPSLSLNDLERFLNCFVQMNHVFENKVNIFGDSNVSTYYHKYTRDRGFCNMKNFIQYSEFCQYSELLRQTVRFKIIEYKLYNNL